MIKVIMPQLSLSMTTGTVSKWFFSEGEYVKKGTPVCEIEGDKAIIEIEAPGDGYLLKIIAKEMIEFPVKEVMAYIGNKEEESGLISDSSAFAKKPSGKLALSEIKANTEMKTIHEIKASPVARRLAEELGVDLTKITGTGPDGIINKNDILAAKALSDSTGLNLVTNTDSPITTASISSQLKLSGIKKIVAERIKESYLDAPHIELSLSVDMLSASEARSGINTKMPDNLHVTFTDILVWAVAKTLKNHKLLNASFHDDTITFFDDINIGLASDTEKGLVVPILRNVDKLNINEISSKRRELIAIVKAGKQTMEILNGGTFTITNLGMFGIEVFKPIITTGQSAILGVGKIKNTPVADESGRMFVRPVMFLNLACDHRVVDGADGARFLADLKGLLENPTSLVEKQ